MPRIMPKKYGIEVWLYSKWLPFKPEWIVWQRYKTEARRDMALKALQRKRNGIDKFRKEH